MANGIPPEEWINRHLSTDGGVQGAPGCLEETGVVIQLIHEAGESRGDLAVLWLNLTNAYRSIPCKLIKTALTRHHVSEMIRNLILNYYSNFRLRGSRGTGCTAGAMSKSSGPWQRHLAQQTTASPSTFPSSPSPSSELGRTINISQVPLPASHHCTGLNTEHCLCFVLYVCANGIF